MWKRPTREFNILQNVLSRMLIFGQDLRVVCTKFDSSFPSVVYYLKGGDDILQLNKS